MPQGLFSIGGIASGLDTNDIVSQLLKLERQPVVRLEQRQQDLQTTRDAWGQLTTKLASVRSATDKLRRPDAFSSLTSVTSSDPDAVSVSAQSGVTQDSQLSFTVEQLATRMQRSSTDRFAGRDAALDGRQLAITDAQGVTHDLTGDLGSEATLGDLVDAVNAAGIGVTADALQVTPGEFQLVLTAEQTGTDGAFQATSSGWSGGFGVTQDAQDAVLRVGGIEVTRSSNTIDDLIDGATLTLNRTTDTTVTVNAERDVDAAVGKVTELAEAINQMNARVGELTDFDPETREAGPLQGQFAATQLGFDLLSAVRAPIDGLAGPSGLASAVGLSVDRDGVIQVDEARLRQAFEEDFEGTAARFSRSGRASDPDAATTVAGSRATQPGSYDVEVSVAADVARVTGASSFPSGAGEPKTFMVRSPGGTMVTVTLDSTQETVSSAAAKIQAALEAAGVTNLNASFTGDPTDGHLTLESTRYGSSSRFEVYQVDPEDGSPIDGGTVFGLEGVHTGVDVEGTIGGVEATGSGRLLSVDEGPAAGLSVTTVGGMELPEEGDRAFTVDFWQGIGGSLDTLLQRSEGSGGTISRARSALDSQMRLYQDRIEAFERRLESREVTLRRQFVAMETAMDRFNSQSEWLQGQIGQLSAINGQR